MAVDLNTPSHFESSASSGQALWTWSNIRRAVTGRWSISFLGGLIIAPLSFLATIPVELQRGDSFGRASLTSFVLLLGSGLILLVAHYSVLRHRRETPSSLAVVIGVYVVAGVVRPIISSWLAPGPFIWESADYTRCIQAGIVAVVSLSVTAVVLDANDRFAKAVVGLRKRNRSLAQARDEQLYILEAERREFAQEVIDPVSRSLREAQDRVRELVGGSLDPSDLSRVASEIRKLSDSEVRSLAHSLRGAPMGVSKVGQGAQVRDGLQENSLSANSGFGWSWIPKSMRYLGVVRPFRPLAISLFIFLLVVPNRVEVLGPLVGIVGTLASATIIFVLLWVASKSEALAREISKSPGRSFALVSIVYPVAGAIGGPLYWLSLEVVFGIARTSVMLGWLMVVVTWLYGVLVALATSLTFMRRLTLAELSVTSEVLEFERDQVVATVTSLRNDLYQSLHGDVQSRLIAISLRIDQASDSLRRARDWETATAQARVTLESSLQELEGIDQLLNHEQFLQGCTQDFEEALQELASLWAGLVVVIIDLSVQARRAIVASRTTEAFVLSLSGEAITNAVKHGKAKRVDIEISRTDGNLIFIAEDNGVGFDPKYGRPGQGLPHQTHDAVEWSLEDVKPYGTRLRVVVPVLADQSIVQDLDD